MATLHSIQHSLDDQNWLTRCLASVSENDGIILLEDAVLISCHLPTLSQLSTLNIKLNFYVIDVDLKARGLLNQFDQKFTLISYQEFVELTLYYDKLVNWA